MPTTHQTDSHAFVLNSATTHCTKNAVISVLVVVFWLMIPTRSIAGGIYTFTTDTSPQPGTDYPASNLSGFVELDNLGNLITFNFAVTVGSDDYVFTPSTVSSFGEFFFVDTISYSPYGPVQTDTLLMLPPNLGTDSPVNSAPYGLDGFTSGFGGGVLTSGLGQWFYSPLSVPEPSTIVLGLIGSLIGLLFARCA